MSSARHDSEEALAEHGLTGSERRVLIGGLGLGYTLRAALDRLDASAQVVVAEISAPVITWNRGPLAALAGSPLADPRVQVEHVDLESLLEASEGDAARFDAILLDVDNGPTALFREANQRLYSGHGLGLLRRALVVGGRLVVWSAGPAPSFTADLVRARFDATELRVPARGRGGTLHTLFLAKRR